MTDLPRTTKTAAGFSPNIDRAKAVQASMALFQLVGKATSDEDDDCHFGTFMGRLAALTGEFALRSGAAAAGITLPPPGHFVVGGLADPYLYGADQNDDNVLRTLLAVEAEEGTGQSRPPDPRAIAAKTAKTIASIKLGAAGTGFPPKPTVSEDCFPQDWSANAGPLLRDDVIATAATFDITEPEEITLALSFAMTAVLCVAKDNNQDLMELIVLAAEVMIPVSRMAPLDRPITR